MKGAEAVTVFVLGAVAAVVSVLVTGLFVMLAALGLHEFVSSSVPALGYGQSILVALALSVVGSFFRR